MPTDFEEQTVEGTPTGTRQVVLASEGNYSLTIPVPSEYEEATKYDADLERLHKEKRQYIEQIGRLLGLYDSPRWDGGDRPLAEGSDGMPVVEYRTRDDADTESSG